VSEPTPPPVDDGDGGTNGGLFKLRADAVDWREVEGEVVVLDRVSSTYLAINATGAALWPALVQGSRAADLVSLLRSEFDVDEQRAEADVRAFVAMLRERDLLEP
jgi:hypothetical protein